jgi:subtilase family serine protease
MKNKTITKIGRQSGVRGYVTAACAVLLLLFTTRAQAAERQVLHGHVPAVVAGLKPAGDFPGTNRLNLAIGLPLRNQEALTHLLRQIYDPANPNYRHYLTPAQFTEQFGPTETDYQAVIAFAKANGLTVTSTDPTRMLVDVRGSVADIERALHVTLRVYQHPTEKRMFHAPDAEPSLDLAVPILRISGLDNYSLPRPRLQATPLANASKTLPNAGSGPSGTYVGKDFRAAYVPDSSLNGSGQIVGLLQFDGYTASDITYYENQAGLPSITLSNVLIDGATGNPSGGGGEVEVSLDIEMAISMATNLSKVMVYMAPNPSPWEDLLNRMANDNLAKQISCSWYEPGGAANTNADQIFQKMAAQGQSFFSASGDYDAYTGLIPFPGDTPYITQVGGTTLTTSGPGGTWVSETVWNWGNGIGSGGGISTQYPIPSWQTNISMTANQGSTTMRNTPDVALTADNVYVRADGQDLDEAGTSCAAPLWAGFMALVNQQAAASGRPPVGFLNPAIYAIGSGSGYNTAFHDITTGNNTSPSSPTKFYAVSGYDLCTGWGTPAGQNLINALANPEALLITPGSGFASIGGVGGPFTITSQSLSLTNAGTNSLTWMLANTSVWLNASPSGGTLAPGGAATTVTVRLNTAASNLLVGTYSATLWFTNLSSGVGQSRQFTLAVISPPTITAQPANQIVLEGAMATFTVGATGGLPLYYQWQDNGTNLTDGGNISGSTTTNLVISNVSAANVGTYTVVVTNLAGVVTSSNALLTITPSPPVITMQPANQTAVVGGTAAFTVAAIGNTPFFYQWSFNGTNNPIAGATNATLTLTNVQLNQAGSYAVTVINLLGSTTSSNATLNVYTVPVITSFSPQSGTVGTVVNISGLNFNPTPSKNIVYFGAVQAVVTAASVTNLVVTVPAGATYAPITETVNGLTAYGNQPFMPTFSGNGSGITVNSFAPRLDLPSGNGPLKVVIADLDGDGKPDLVVADVFGNTISLYRNISTNGSLTADSFAPRVDLVTPLGNYDSPYGLVVADVDGDSKLDIIVSDMDESIVSVYRNTCTPGNISSDSFATRVDFATGAQPQGVEVRDIDGDGKPDLLVANSGDGTVSILRNTGVMGSLTTNSFAPKVDIATGSGCDSVAVGDLDGDGKPDVVTANDGADTVSLLRNISTPGSITTNSFAAAVDIAVLTYPVQVAIGDLDGDGKPDLIVTFYFPQTVGVLRNTSTVGSLTTNSFAPMVDFPLGGRGHTPAIADLDGDGKPDLAVVTELNSLLSIFCNTSTPGSFTNSSFAARVDYSAGYNPNGIAIGDLDGDGRPDIVFANTYDNTISIYQNEVPFGGPPVITSQPTNQTVVVGGTASFSVMASGTPPLNYQWNFNGTNLAGATNATLTLTNVQLSQAGNYAVLVTNVYGSVTSSNAVLMVSPDHFVWSTIASPQYVNQPFGVTITAKDVFGTTVSNFNGTAVLSATSGQPDVLHVDFESGLQVFSINNSFGSGNGLWHLSTGRGSNPGHSFSNSLYYGHNEGPSGGGNYDPGTANGGVVTSSSIALPSGTGPITLSFNYLMDVESLTAYDQAFVEVSINNGVSYTVVASKSAGLTYNTGGQWVSNNIALSQFAGSTILLRFRFDTIDSYVNDTEGWYLDDIVIHSGTGSTPVSLTPTNTGAFAAGVWTGNVTVLQSATNVVLRADDGNGHSGSSNPFDVVAPNPPVILVQPTNQTVFLGVTVNFSVTASGTLPLSYQWNFNGTNISGATNTNLTLTNVQLNQAGNYTVIITNTWGSVTSSVATLTVAPSPIIYQIICNADGSVTLNLLTAPNIISRVLAATNLAPPVVWQPLCTNVAGASGAWQFTDTNASQYPIRFYRSYTP